MLQERIEAESFGAGGTNELIVRAAVKRTDLGPIKLISRAAHFWKSLRHKFGP
jgi:hypothetical protein